jgi:cell division protein FtsN
MDAGTAEKPRFDFDKILPGVEEPKVQAKSAERPAPDKATAERAVAPDKTPAKVDDRAASPDKTQAKVDGRLTPPQTDKAAKAVERFWLQAGSFASEADAENLKARLAFAGWEAVIQSANLPDKGLRYRVRVGPYDNTDELARVKGELAKRGFDVAVIKF